MIIIPLAPSNFQIFSFFYYTLITIFIVITASLLHLPEIHYPTSMRILPLPLLILVPVLLMTSCVYYGSIFHGPVDGSDKSIETGTGLSTQHLRSKFMEAGWIVAVNGYYLDYNTGERKPARYSISDYTRKDTGGIFYPNGLALYHSLTVVDNKTGREAFEASALSMNSTFAKKVVRDVKEHTIEGL